MTSTGPSGDLAALWLTFRLATVTTAILLVVATPLAWWLARTGSRWRAPVVALVALPAVLPPTVIGFYLLVALGPRGPLGQATEALGLGLLPFTFGGLVVGSVVYSLPFVVQPLQVAFANVGRGPLEAAAALGAGPWDRFLTVALPLARPGYALAAALGFAHTVGEFGVVLMIGGNIPGRTRTAAVQIYDHVEALRYGQAHTLAAVLVAFSFVAVLAVALAGRRTEKP